MFLRWEKLVALHFYPVSHCTQIWQWMRPGISFRLPENVLRFARHLEVFTEHLIEFNCSSSTDILKFHWTCPACQAILGKPVHWVSGSKDHLPLILCWSCDHIGEFFMNFTFHISAEELKSWQCDKNVYFALDVFPGTSVWYGINDA